ALDTSVKRDRLNAAQISICREDACKNLKKSKESFLAELSVVLAMHKTFYTVSPCQSRYLQKQFDEAAYERHRKERVKPVVDTSSPMTYMHLYAKPKKLQMDAERQAIVDYENRQLLEKITQIMKSGSGLDNHCDYTPRSLNTKRRQRDLIGVTRGNKVIMERVLQSSRDSELANWQEDWQQSFQHMDRISRYPNDWWVSDRVVQKNSRCNKFHSKINMRQSDTQSHQLRAQAWFRKMA
uniref:ERIC3 protein n=1 Tax=Macrostomum lignano TaxID=282301 RepID=A0A1I8J9Q2_9PLAT